jgi:hypothetical protein
MDSLTPLPLTADVSLLPASGICWPLRPTWTVSLPGWPASSELSADSTPAWPVMIPLGVVVKPTTLAVTDPSGYDRE